MKVKTLALVFVCAGVTSGTSGRVAAEDPFLPPLYATLGCEGANLNALTVNCEGSDPYNQMSCTFTRVLVTKQDAATSKKNRAEWLAATAKLTDAQRQAQIADACQQIAKKPAIDFEKVGPAIQMMRDRGLRYMRTICDCKGKEPACLTQAMSPTLDAEERACMVTVTAHQDTFTRVAKNRWVFNESLPLGCVAATTQVLENDPQHSGLWTYTLNEVAAHPNPFPNDPLCAQFKGTNEVCSWRHPATGLMNCEEVHLR